MINIFTTDYTPEKIIKKIKSGEWNDILTKLCNSKDDSIFLDHTFFKHFASKETYPILTNYILIPKFGALGAAYATVLTYFVFWVISWKLSDNIIKLPWLYFIKS